MQQKRDELASRTMPPQALFDHAYANPEAIRLGAGLNQAYTAVLRTQKKGAHSNVLERAKYVAEDYLAHFPPERRQGILLGALASVYGKEERGSDAAVWLAGRKDEQAPTQPGTGLSSIGPSSIAHQTIEALRQISLLDDIVVTKEGLVVYPSEMAAELDAH
jgi:hypothetical protein